MYTRHSACPFHAGTSHWQQCWSWRWKALQSAAQITFWIWLFRSNFTLTFCPLLLKNGSFAQPSLCTRSTVMLKVFVVCVKERQYGANANNAVPRGLISLSSHSISTALSSQAHNQPFDARIHQPQRVGQRTRGTLCAFVWPSATHDSYNNGFTSCITEEIYLTRCMECQESFWTERKGIVSRELDCYLFRGGVRAVSAEPCWVL